MYLHLYLHARKVTGSSSDKKLKEIRIPLNSLKNLISSLRRLIAGLRSAPGGTEWAAYYDTMLNYSDEAFKSKGALVAQFLDACAAESVCDLGANRGEFSNCAAQRANSFVVAYDIDHTAVNQHYLQAKAKGRGNVLPLVIDLTNPSPAIGWANQERASLEERAGFDCVMALALIHHMAISNNVPKIDSQVQKLLLNRGDIFEDYTQPGFESAFSRYFELMKKEPVAGAQRTLYLYRTKNERE